MSRRIIEILTGLAVIAVAAGFLMFALSKANAISAGGYPLLARFSSIDGLATGADVKVAGVTVGHVASERLHPVTYAAVVQLDVDNGVQIPADSSASITSAGLLGGNYVAISPGGSNTMLKPGASFGVTQSAINIEDLLGKFIFSAASMNKGGSGTGSGTQQAAPASAGAP